MQSTIKKLTSGRRWLWIVGGVIVIGIAAFAYTQIAASASPANAQTTKATTTRVTTGDISGSVTASGNLQAHQDISLSLQSSGIVKEVNVKVGDQVTAGQTLLKLDDTTAQRDLLAAQNALEEAKLNAQSAQVTYNSGAGYQPSESSLASAIANANNAAAEVQAAQADYDRVKWNPDVSGTSQSSTLAQATNNYIAAKASLDSVLNTRPDLASPKIALDLANLQVKDAEFSLEAAQETLDELTLVAPFSGTIKTISADVGETASGVVIEIISTDNMEGLLTVGEADMTSLAINQPVTFSLSAWPSTTLTGKVIAIDPAPTSDSTSDVVNYGITISVDKTDLPILVGMTINATITTFDLKGVLLAPNGAVTLDEDGKYYVSQVVNGQTQKTEVKIGVHSSQYTQILSGLKEGDEIQVSATTSSSSSTRSGAGAGMMMGGGGPGPGGQP
jgi:RND family efflux transporter MFP subunit